jgi:hypothetical protein
MKRYKQVYIDRGYGQGDDIDFVESDEGEWVAYEDVEQLKAEIERLNATADAKEKALLGYEESIEELIEENERLKSAILDYINSDPYDNTGGDCSDPGCSYCALIRAVEESE